jgi:LytS/YehU family sensor histidine kinase
MPMVFVLGVLLFGLVLAIYYLLAAFEQTREAESRALEARVLAVEAELRALRAQIDPHFLFNSLHSIGALAGTDPSAARGMSQRLADFLRASLKFGAMSEISLADELALAEHYLSVEQVRFGSRLRIDLRVAADTTSCRVPPLILQPLVENAVTHGIANLIDGGTISVSTARTVDRLEIAIENPCDPDRRAQPGTGVGLENVRLRLEALFGRRARLDVVRAADRFRVEVTLPLAG